MAPVAYVSTVSSPVAPAQNIVPPMIQKLDAQVQSTVRRVFHQLLNWVSTLPVNDVTTWMQGGLLMLRKSLLNQTPSVSAVQTVNHPTLVKGTIDVIDPDGDPYSMEVVSKPTQGTVVLAQTAQANGIGTTKYTYTPGAGYAGADEFVVKVTSPPDAHSVNVFHPFGALDARYYTVSVGDAAVKESALGSDAKDTLDTTLYMANAGATVAVTNKGWLVPNYSATVTLSAASARRAFDWMDSRGRSGSVSADTMLTKNWDAYAAKATDNGAKPILMFSYTDKGADNVVLVDVDKVGKNADGTYTFTGQLSQDAPAQDGVVDKWDFAGAGYKSGYENFLTKLKDCNSGAACTTVTAIGTLGATTLSSSAFAEAGGHDYPSSARISAPRDTSASQTNPGGMGPGSTNVNEGNGNADNSTGDVNLTAMVPWGNNGSFITATNMTQSAGANNGIYLYTATAPTGSTPNWTPTQLQGNGWAAAVNVMMPYTQIVTDSNGNPVAQTFAGSLTPPLIDYSLSGSISASGTTPASFVASVTGDTLQVTSLTSGTIKNGDYVVGGTASNSKVHYIVGGGTGGVGEYQILPYQTSLASTALTSGQGGTTLQLDVASLPSAVAPSALVGGLVAGTNVVPGTTITSYTGINGNTATYTVNTYNLLATEALTVSAPTGPVNSLTLTLPGNINPGSLIGQAITGQGIAEGTVINGFFSDTADALNNFTYTTNNPIASTTAALSVTTPNLYATQTGLVVGLSNGAIEYWNGLGCAQSSTGCSGVAGSAGQYGGGWTQLSPEQFGTTGDIGCSAVTPCGVTPINTMVALPNSQGIVFGLGNGSVELWNSTIQLDGTIIPGPNAPYGCSTASPGSCLVQLQGSVDFGTQNLNSVWKSPVNAMIPSGQNGGVIVGLANGAVEQWNASTQDWTELQGAGGWGSGVEVNTLLPYESTGIVGAIGGAPVVASNGVIGAPSYAGALAGSAALAAATDNCTTSYNSGSGVGCSGYVLTVTQVAAGKSLRVGETLYGGAGLTPGTTITAQISDGNGSLCATSSCSAGGAGVYLVDNAELVAPGTPMSASDGTGFVVGLSNGSLYQYVPGSPPSVFFQLEDSQWESAVNAVIPWRDGLVAGLNNGATFYWSPSNNPNGNNPNNYEALSYAGSTVPSQNSQSSGWSQLQGSGWDNAVTAMTQIGDGFAVGLTAPNSGKNGAIFYYSGYGPASTTEAFGYQPSINGVSPLYANNSFYQIANQSSLSGDSPQGSVQQLVPISATVPDPSGSGVLQLSQSLIAGLTNNAVYAWTGTSQDAYNGSGGLNTPGVSYPWALVQASDTGGKPTLNGQQLNSAFTFAQGTNAGIAFGQPGGVGDPNSDPVFGLPNSQAWCGTGCSSSGDYVPIVFSKAFGSNGVIYSWPDSSDGIQADINLTAVGYGYLFVPNGVWDKFHPDDCSLGMLLAVQGDPSATLTLPSISWSDSKNVPVFTDTIDLGEFGDVTINAGLDLTASLAAQLGATTPLTLAYALYTPGLLLTWNAAGYQDALSLSGAFGQQTGTATLQQIIGTIDDPSLTASAGVTPSLNINWGLTAPSNVPFVGGDSLVGVGVGYSNPVSFNVTIPNLTAPDPQLSVTSAGILNVNAGLLPSITSLLSWSDTIQLYSFTDQIST